MGVAIADAVSQTKIQVRFFRLILGSWDLKKNSLRVSAWISPTCGYR